MSEKIAISNIVTIVFTSLVVGSTLLVGLLPVYINPPDCPINESSNNNKNSKTFNITYCNEIIQPDVIYYPWQNPRLPSNVIPTHYDLYLDLPLWNFETSIYNGEVDITLNVTSQTQFILLHFELRGYPEFVNLTDKNGAIIEIECDGISSENNKYEYFVLKTKNMLTVENGPYVISLKFQAALNEFESGLFMFHFGSDFATDNKNL
jgi:hypothetical protein